MSLIVNEPVPAEARDGLGRLGLSGAFDAIYAAADEFVQSEQAFRKGQRMQFIGFALTDEEATAESIHNDAGLRYIEQALTEVHSARTQLDPAVVKRVDATIGTTDGQHALAKARESFATQLAEQDMALLADFQEILQEWDKCSQLIMSAGFSGLLGELESTIARVRDLRSSPGRGREPGSPLPFWKIASIAVAIGMALGVVIACYVWFGCKWVTAFLQWYAPSMATVVLLGC